MDSLWLRQLANIIVPRKLFSTSTLTRLNRPQFTQASVEDDLDALVKQFAAEPSADQRMLRLNGIAAFYGGWKRL